MVKQFITHYGFSYGYGDLKFLRKQTTILDDIQGTYDIVADLTDQYEKAL